jgi:cytochrome b561
MDVFYQRWLFSNERLFCHRMFMNRSYTYVQKGDQHFMSMNASVVVQSKPKRYSPVLVTLHWIIAILIFGTALLAMGGDDRRGGGAAPTIAGIPILGIHMILGTTILVLLIIRLIVRWRTQHPEWASTGNRFLDKVGEITHWALYFFTFCMTVTGIFLATQGNRLARTFGLAGARPQGQFQPGQFRPRGFSIGMFHGAIWFFLLLLVLLHIGAALYHQFFLKDNLLGRMWYGKQTE